MKNSINSKAVKNEVLAAKAKGQTSKVSTKVVSETAILLGFVLALGAAITINAINHGFPSF